MNLEGTALSFLRWFKRLIFGSRDYLEYFNQHYPDSHPIKHEHWTELLQKHLRENGDVNYRSFLTDKSALEEYFGKLSENPPNNIYWTKEDQLAYWINLYNASTVKLILDNYPISSIRDIKSGFQLPFFNSVFDIQFIQVGNKKLSLNDVEHAVLRTFDEPRIHFAINCGSSSCPVLKPEAFEGDILEKQLMESTLRFLSDNGKNQLNKGTPKLSRIFNWYLDDFGGKSGLREKIKSWIGRELPEEKIEYRHYDWKLNENEEDNAKQAKKENKQHQ